MEALSNFGAHFVAQIMKYSEKSIYAFVNFADPIVVSIVLFIILSPFALLYICAQRIAVTKFTQMEIKGKKILYVIAHPDDESMFFQPSIETLKQTNRIFLLCLSNGNADGLGRTREKELELSCKALGFSEAPICLDDPDLQDGMDKNWAPELIAEQVAKFCRQKEVSEGPTGKIDMIVTFDAHGVSSHPNHIACFYGIEMLMKKKLIDVEVMTLSTVNLFRKYIGFIDVNFVFNDEWQAFRFNPCKCYRNLAIHETQMVWFRKLFIIFSRYSYLNSFTRYIQAPTAADKMTAETAFKGLLGKKSADGESELVTTTQDSEKSTSKVNID